MPVAGVVCRGVGRGGFSGASAAAPPLSGYLAVAFRRVGLKTPGGVVLPPPGSGGRWGPRGVAAPGGGSLGLPVPSAAPRRGRGPGAPSRAPVGLGPRARLAPSWGAVAAGASRVEGSVCLSSFRFSRPRPSLSLCRFFFHDGRPEASPPLLSPFSSSPLRGGGAEGKGGAVPPSPRGGRSSLPLTFETIVRLLAVDHSARASMKNAASCEN